MPAYFERLDLRDYGLVISSSHACAVNVRPADGAVHVCYCYTPMRYAWLPETERARARGVKGAVLRAFVRRLRRIDLRASARPHSYVAISTAVQERVRRFYGRESVVIHPPVDLDDLRPDRPKDRERFVWVHRLVSYKRPLEVAEAFRDTPFRLTMVGVGPLERELRRRLPPNVELRGWLPRAELAELYASAGGFVHVGEEDFGISMVEALAGGTPVVALARGGALDVVRDDREGVLVERSDPAVIRDAVAAVAAREWDPDALAARAADFSRARFLERMSEHLDGLLRKRGA
jgi:glycosyltransferase involved in cell wall biosynthesis